jgi:hypothetical protein
MCILVGIKLLRNPDGDVGPMYQERVFLRIIVQDVGSLEFQLICLILRPFLNQKKERRMGHSIINSSLKDG